MSAATFARDYPAYMTQATAAALLEYSRQRRVSALHVCEQMLRDVRAQGAMHRAYAEAIARRAAA